MHKEQIMTSGGQRVAKFIVGAVAITFVFALGFFVGLSDKRVPQETMLRADFPIVQELFNTLNKNQVVFVQLREGVELGTLKILDVYNSGRVYGLGGGKFCKAYKFIATTSGAREVGVLCKRNNGLPPNEMWVHVPWREHFRRLG